MEMGLEGQSVLITGSSRGIGRGIAEGFLREKALVVLCGRDRESLDKTACELSNVHGEDRVLHFKGDLKSAPILQSLSQLISEKCGGLNHLVCNIGSGQSVPPLEEDVDEFQRMLEINLLNAVGVVTQLLPLMELEANAVSSGSITLIGSICGIEALGCPIAYAAAKAALVSYAKNLARPLGKRGIRVNVVSPGNIMFSGSTWEKKLENNPKRVRKMLRDEVALGRFGDVVDIADVVVFLASKRAAYVSGVNWIVDGGQVRS